MSKDRWFQIYEEKFNEAMDRGLKHPDEWAAAETEKEYADRLAAEADFLADWQRDERALGGL